MKTQLHKKAASLRNLLLIGFLVLTIAFAGCDQAQDDYVAPLNTDTQLKSGKALKKTDKSIATIATEAGFTELLSALIYVDESLDAGLVDLFANGTDQYTVFAPTNDAFNALYDALGIDGITDLDASTVLDVLLYHVTDGRRAANSVVPKNGMRTIETLNGATFMVDPDLMIYAVGNYANITSANISASNGVVHVIDMVLLPF